MIEYKLIALHTLYYSSVLQCSLSALRFGYCRFTVQQRIFQNTHESSSSPFPHRGYKHAASLRPFGNLKHCSNVLFSHSECPDKLEPTAGSTSQIAQSCTRKLSGVRCIRKQMRTTKRQQIMIFKFLLKPVLKQNPVSHCS